MNNISLAGRLLFSGVSRLGIVQKTGVQDLERLRLLANRHQNQQNLTLPQSSVDAGKTFCRTSFALAVTNAAINIRRTAITV